MNMSIMLLLSHEFVNIGVISDAGINLLCSKTSRSGTAQNWILAQHKVGHVGIWFNRFVNTHNCMNCQHILKSECYMG